MTLSGPRRSRHRPSPGSLSSPILILLALLILGKTARCGTLYPLPRPAKGTGIHDLAERASERDRGRGWRPPRRAEEEGDDVDDSLPNTKPIIKRDLSICSVEGGMDLTRIYSTVVRSTLATAVEDAEFLREFITESMGNDGLRGGMSNLTEMASTLRWKVRKDAAENTLNWTQECHEVLGLVKECEGWENLTAESTTLTAGLGWVDDRRDRRVERYVSSTGQPFVGTKQSDMDFLDTASSILPWLLDRKSREDHWFKDHQNGRSEGRNKETFPFTRLYRFAWALSWGGASTMYPPIMDNMTSGDLVGANFDVWSYLNYSAPSGWPFDHVVPGGSVRDTIMSDPYYIDDGVEAVNITLSGLTALAPVYFTGKWRGYDYSDTFLGAVGMDVRMEALDLVFDLFEDGLCEGSFALLADSNTFQVISTSQGALESVYPERTGTDDKWPEERKNETFTVRDTQYQGLDGLVSADWEALHEMVQATRRGSRGLHRMNLTVTGEAQSREYYAMFDRWRYVADYVMIAFAPVEQVSGAIHPVLSHMLRMEIMKGDSARGVSTLSNNGTMKFKASLSRTGQIPEWVELVDIDMWIWGIVLVPGESVDIVFVVETAELPAGRVSFNLALDIVETVHQNCFYSETIVHQIMVNVTQETDLNQLSKSVRAIGLSMCGVALATAVAFASWVWWFRKKRVVLASQPLFLIMICFGCLIMASAIIPLSFDDRVASQRGCDMACMAFPWLVLMGNVVIFAALFSKIWRINKIFGHANFRRITVTERDVLIPFAVLFSSNFLFLLCWTIVDPVRWTREKTGAWSSHGYCTVDGTAGIVFASLCVFINFTAMVLACVQAYRARRIDDEYSESKWIAISLGGMLQVWILGAPLLFLVREDSTALFFTETALIFVLSMSILLLIFVPKMVFMKKKEKEQAKKKADKLARANNNNVTVDMTLTDESKNKISDTSSDHVSPGLRITHNKGMKGSNNADLIEKLRWTQGEAEAFKEENDMLKRENEKLESLLRQHGISFESDLTK